MLLTEKQLELVDKQIKKLIKTDSFTVKNTESLALMDARVRRILTEFLSHQKTIYDSHIL